MVVPNFLATASERRAVSSMEQDVVWGKDDDEGVPGRSGK